MFVQVYISELHFIVCVCLVSDKEVEIQTSPTERMKEDAMITEKESPKGTINHVLSI